MRRENDLFDEILILQDHVYTWNMNLCPTEYCQY